MARASRIIREFHDRAAMVRSVEELARLLEAVARELGFEFIAFLHSRSLLQHDPRLIRYDTYPEGWDRRLIGRGHKLVDPVLSIARRRVSVFRWTDGLAGASLTKVQSKILREAMRVGIRRGITVPANVPGEPEGSISFATGHVRRISDERVLIADAVGRIAFDAARRLAGIAVAADTIPHVSDRVRECIFWIAHGKTTQDIADILGIDLETVRTYVKSAFRLLNVITRGQLVHEALRLGLIDFVPSIPPYG